MELLQEFFNIAQSLNTSLKIIPVLYGSVGLQYATGLELVPQDIDILIPLEQLESGWAELRNTMEALGYQLEDLREHEFKKNCMKVAFAHEEDLLGFAQVDYAGLRLVEVQGVKFKVLGPSDYLKVYSRSLKDGYRRKKNNQKDLVKIQLLQGVLDGLSMEDANG